MGTQSSIKFTKSAQGGYIVQILSGEGGRAIGTVKRDGKGWVGTVDTYIVKGRTRAEVGGAMAAFVRAKRDIAANLDATMARKATRFERRAAAVATYALACIDCGAALKASTPHVGDRCASCAAALASDTNRADKLTRYTHPVTGKGPTVASAGVTPPSPRLSESVARMVPAVATIKVTPGKCPDCGRDDNWLVNAENTVYCGCDETCVDCGRRGAFLRLDGDPVCLDCHNRRGQRQREGSDCMLDPATHAPCYLCRIVKRVCCSDSIMGDGSHAAAACRDCCQCQGAINSRRVGEALKGPLLAFLFALCGAFATGACSTLPVASNAPYAAIGAVQTRSAAAAQDAINASRRTDIMTRAQAQHDAKASHADESPGCHAEPWNCGTDTCDCGNLDSLNDAACAPVCGPRVETIDDMVRDAADHSADCTRPATPDTADAADPGKARQDALRMVRRNRTVR